MKFILAYVATLVPMLILDAVWLGLVAKQLYSRYLGALMTEQVNWWAAGIFYLLYAFGIYFFIVQPAVASGSVVTALWRGALFGLIAYATYDLTNLATLRNWPIPLTLIDLAWGALITASTAGIATALIKYIK